MPQVSWANAKKTQEEEQHTPIKRRSRLETKHDILRAIQREGEARPTHIMYKANVSWTVMQDFLKGLESQSLITIVSQRSGHNTYTLTEKGIECLQTLVLAKSLLCEEEGLL